MQEYKTERERERERGKEGEKVWERERERDGKCVCVCVCLCVWGECYVSLFWQCIFVWKCRPKKVKCTCKVSC